MYSKVGLYRNCSSSGYAANFQLFKNY